MSDTDQPTPPAVPEPTWKTHVERLLERLHDEYESAEAEGREGWMAPYDEWVAICELQAALAAERDNRLAADEAMVTLHGALEKAETELAALRERAEKAEAEVEELVSAIGRQQHGASGLCCALRGQEKNRADRLRAEVEGLRRGLERLLRVAFPPDPEGENWLEYCNACARARQLLEKKP